MSFPPEIWTYILARLPLLDLPKLLQVSHAIHDLALPLVFSAVKIYFIGGDAAFQMLSTTHEDFKEETTAKLMTRSYELLRRMTRDPSFARVIKSLTVITSSDSESTFEYLLLADALSALPNLQTFRWFGTNPGLVQSVSDALPHDISRLVLKTYVPSLDLFERVTSISQLALPTPFFYPDDEEAHDDATASSALLDITATIDFGGIMTAVSPHNLQSLTLNAEHLSRFPIKVLETLKELDICVTTVLQAGGLDLIFRHAHVLESLTIFGYVDQDVFQWLACDASNLPALRSFRLSCDRFSMVRPPEAHELDVLLKFLGGRYGLRRLYLRVPSIDFSALTALAPVIRQMKSLEVLGIHTGLTVVNDWFIPFIGSILPAGLTALHLAIDWNGTNLIPMIDYLAHLRKLEFFHAYGINSRLPVLVSDIASTVASLKRIGLNRGLWDIDRDGTELELKKWPRWKIKFCTEEDFERRDDYWLFQYN